MTKKRSGKYPNKTDFEPYYGRETKNSGGHYELPLADPSESNATEVFHKKENNYDDAANKPSAFSENKKIQLKANGSLV